MRAYRKPLQEAPRDVFHFVPFFDGVDDRQMALERRLRDEGTAALAAGDRIAARRALLEALRLNPRRLKTWSRLLRTFWPLPARDPADRARGAAGDQARGAR